MAFESDNIFGVLVANIRNHLKNNLEKDLQEYDISPAQSIIIRRLCEKDNLTQKELAKDTYFKQSSLTLLIDKLEQKGLVERKNKKNDRRAYLICITTKGKNLEKIIKDAGKKVEDEALKDINENTKELMIQTLKKVYSNLK
ncbi:MarR family transcriptional regulator [Malaciobacter molluscorum LMG 25693]|uniref:MarR family transcriptional regulator n=1 Tax=Malaciobacter molluscorum LMG 25693 TaxID=870501 RepID=A0A2G1DIK1_9BACT|nr:MarR family transcriptional regulator [Malaciobacter molluscorum]AXX91923.1 transcriptional regulator, MarR family [Malaciobacter molluscorum LMG 25693]PHO18325.1 MarR family transcriptional regulator [Malaciobacter molluscorum LMG 25693]RXJ94208.1 MarR family transcriptional regulator [Malaciobacter molluscorum]